MAEYKSALITLTEDLKREADRYNSREANLSFRIAAKMAELAFLNVFAPRATIDPELELDQLKKELE